MRDVLRVPRSEEVPRTVPLHGAIAGAIGGFVVAVVYLVIDVAIGRPFYTPNALGAALFRGDSLGLAAPIEPVLVFGYTLVHGGVFLGFGLLAAFVFLELLPRRSRSAGTELVEAAIAAFVLFVAFEITFEIFGWLLVPGEGRLGGARAALANALAAVAMAGYLSAARTRWVERP